MALLLGLWGRPGLPTLVRPLHAVPLRPNAAVHSRHCAWDRASPRPLRPLRSSSSSSDAAPEPPGQQQSQAKEAQQQGAQQQPFLWSSAVVSDSEVSVEDAVAEAVRRATAGWPEGATPSLAFVFVSSSYQRLYGRVLPTLLEKVPSLEHVVGCSGYGVLGYKDGAPEEWEGQPALSVALACLPGVALRSFHLAPTALPDADAPPAAWHSLLGVPPSVDGGHTSFVLLPDAAFGGVTDLLAGLDYAYPEARKVGGLNSSASANTRRALWQWSAKDGQQDLSDGLHSSGCVGLALQGPLLMDTVVAQGCRPLGGGILSVTKAHKTLVIEVQQEAAAPGEGQQGQGKEGGRGWGNGRKGGSPGPPLSVVTEQLAKLSPEERERSSRNLMVGLAPDDFKAGAELGPGDFLVRGLLGADPGSGALMVGDVVRVGQRLQFMVRDREGAMQDLVSHGVELKKRELIAQLAGAPLPLPVGLLVFTCNGRGRGLFREPHFDSRTLAEYVPAPSAGFFCNGEIGAVGNTTHLHGFTCAAAIFRPARPEQPQQPQQEAGAQQQQQQRQQGGQQGEQGGGDYDMGCMI